MGLKPKTSVLVRPFEDRDTDIHGDCHMMKKAEITIMHLKHQGILVTTRR